MLPDPRSGSKRRRCCARLWARACTGARRRRSPRGATRRRSDAVYDTPFYRRFRARGRVVRRPSQTVVAATRGAVRRRRSRCSASCRSSSFPASSRPELMVDLRLPEGSVVRGDARARRRRWKRSSPRIRASRTTSTLRRQRQPALLPAARPAAAAVELRAVRASSRRATRSASACARACSRCSTTTFPSLRGRVSRLENGPPVGFPVQFRVSGEDIADRARDRAGRSPRSCARTRTRANVQFDWDEPSKVIRLDDRPEQGARARHLVAGPAAFLNNCAVRASP